LPLAWFLYIRARYAASPGMDRETWIAYNLTFWTNLKNYFRFPFVSLMRDYSIRNPFSREPSDPLTITDRL
jgi:hypothetical protein